MWTFSRACISTFGLPRRIPHEQACWSPFLSPGPLCTRHPFSTSSQHLFDAISDFLQLRGGAIHLFQRRVVPKHLFIVLVHNLSLPVHHHQATQASALPLQIAFQARVFFLSARAVLPHGRVEHPF